VATILFTWELGGGWGHLLPHREVLARLAGAGHRVHVAAGAPARARQAFGGIVAACDPLPQVERRPTPFHHPTQTFAHVLHNVGFGDPDGLAARTAGVAALIERIRPDLVLADYSPTVLLALRGLGIPRVVIGMGFFIPPDRSPLPAFPLFEHHANRAALVDDEAAVLRAMNVALDRNGRPPLERVAQLFADVEETVLMASRELDHTPARAGATYWGVPPTLPGEPVRWPDGRRRKVFGYLKPAPCLEPLCDMLNGLALPTVIAADGIPPGFQRRFASPTLRFETASVDLAQAARDCYCALTTGGMTTAQFLLAGKPMLIVPRTLEQELLARRVETTGAGGVVRTGRPEQVGTQFARLFNDPRHREAAAAFAARHQDDPPGHYVLRVVGRIEQLLSPSRVIAAGCAETLLERTPPEGPPPS
jgi:hypothetical protein